MPRPYESGLQVSSPSDLEEQKREVSVLVASGHYGAALIAGWATLEALARLAFPDRLQKPQRPGSVLEMLAYGGYITPTQAERVRPMIAQRNRLVHGDLAVRLNGEDIREFVRIISAVHELVQTTEAA